MCPFPSPRRGSISAAGQWAVPMRLRADSVTRWVLSTLCICPSQEDIKELDSAEFKKATWQYSGFYQKQPVSRSHCEAVQPKLGYFFACFDKLKCSSPQAHVPGDPRASIIYCDSLPAPAPRPVAARAANHLSPCHHRDGNFTAGSFNHVEFAARALSPSLLCDGLENSTKISFLAERTQDPMGTVLLSRSGGSAGSASSLCHEASRLQAVPHPWRHLGCAAHLTFPPCGLNYELSFCVF